MTNPKSRLVIQTEETVFDGGEHREVILEVGLFTATVRLKGLKSSFEISWAAVYHLAAKMQVENERRNKKAKGK